MNSSEVSAADTTDPALDLLQSVFGYETFRGLQREVIEAALAGRDALVLMPTGAGKSLCYQIPALVRPGTGLVISPLIALMQDQVTALRELGIRAEYLNSTLDGWTQQDIVDRLRRGEVDLLYVAPERLLTDRGRAELSDVPLSLIAIDEAHCVSQWGHDFRVDYLGLHALRELFPGIPRMALTATADVRSREEIAERLALAEPARFVASFDRPEIRYRVAAKTDARRQLEAFLRTHEHEAGIVYCMSRKKVEQTAETLAASGRTALPYHAGLPAEVRARNQERFLREDGVIMVATIAFGMGIDKPDVRFVVHLDLPKSMEGFYQETGRAGRDGLAAETLLLYGLQDVVRIRQMVDGSESDEDRKRVERAKLDALLGWCELTDCRRVALLAYFGETLPAPCGNCDVCLEPPETWDATVPAQKLISCVLRTEQRFGGGHVIDVLLGRDTEKVSQHRHDRLSTFGIGAELDEKGWRSVLRQLVVRGYLTADPDRFNALRPTGRARPLLKGAETLHLRRDPRPARASRRERGGGIEAALPPADVALFDALRACRRRLADEAGVPPYVVFHDATLLDMARRRPTTLVAMLEVSGVGDAKLDKYGDDFLNVILGAEYPEAEAHGAAEREEP
ncbi:MAG: DNA helicase RecQ [Pseudomonadales bacterium]|jgi:ATP-dependent DNA helicase RecQ|nr:DNA helicase RecQ [Pseudomonadales bacterium]